MYLFLKEDIVNSFTAVTLDIYLIKHRDCKLFPVFLSA